MRFNTGKGLDHMMIRLIQAIFGKRKIIRSHIQKPLQHKGIYTYQEYMKFVLAEEEKRRAQEERKEVGKDWWDNNDDLMSA